MSRKVWPGRGSAFSTSQSFTDPVTWTIVPLAVIVPFALLVWQGWERRRDAPWHKRLMLSAAILVVMGPTLGRIPLLLVVDVVKD